MIQQNHLSSDHGLNHQRRNNICGRKNSASVPLPDAGKGAAGRQAKNRLPAAFADMPPGFGLFCRTMLKRQKRQGPRKNTFQWEICMSEEKQNLESAIRKNASGPKSAQVDGQRVEQHSLDDVIKADKYLALKKASKSRTGGLKFTKMSHSGA